MSRANSRPRRQWSREYGLREYLEVKSMVGYASV